MLDLCKHCVRALELGVTRAHLLPPTPGALIQELYTTDGIGTLISRDVYDGIRLAVAGDIPSILDLIAPLEAAGVTARPSKKGDGRAFAADGRRFAATRATRRRP